MIKAGQIRIRKRTLPEWSAILIVLLPFVFSFFVELVHLPNAIRFVSDMLIALSLVLIGIRSFTHGKLRIPRNTSPLLSLVLVFLLYTFIAYLFHFQSPFYYLWGMRNNFRFYAAFFIFISFFSEEEAQAVLDFLDVLFWLHLVITLVQFFVLGYEQDYLGGLFGVTKGSNGYVVIFLIVVVSKALLTFMNGSGGVVSCVLKCGAALLVAALAELKIFFVIFILLLIISAITTSFSLRKTVLIVLASILLMVAYTILVTLFENFKNFLSFEYLLDQLVRDNYASSEDLGRFTAIPTICDTFLPTRADQAFGMGLGNCDTSTISLFNTDFYDTYVDIHYSIFSVSFMFMETGFVGLTLFTLFFVSIFCYSLVNYRRKQGNKFFNQMGLIMSSLCLVIMFYNSSLRTEAGYIAYFVMALPFIGRWSQQKSEVPDNG